MHGCMWERMVFVIKWVIEFRCGVQRITSHVCVASWLRLVECDNRLSGGPCACELFDEGHNFGIAAVTWLGEPKLAGQRVLGSFRCACVSEKDCVCVVFDCKIVRVLVPSPNKVVPPFLHPLSDPTGERTRAPRQSDCAFIFGLTCSSVRWRRRRWRCL